MISISRVSKFYNGRSVLKDINLRLNERETHVFLGSSGSGKTTLLRIMSGLIEADEGEVLIHGEKIFSIRKQIAYVIQEGGLFPHLTAFDNISLAAKISKWPKSQIEKRITELAELVQLDLILLQQFPKQLSGGQRQRVALMRALMLDPPLILLDEPLGALDPLVRADLQKELKRIFNVLKKTVVMVTHDIGEGAFFGHTVSLFHEGSVVQSGTFEELAKKPANDFVKKFISAQLPPPELLGSI